MLIHYSSHELYEVRERILSKAEPLFAERGYHGVSLGEIATVAEVDYVALTYYFAGKKGLFSEIVARRTRPINQRRLDLLKRALKGSSHPRSLLTGILDAYARPLFELVNTRERQADVTSRLLVRILTETDPVSQESIDREMRSVEKEFALALTEACPELRFSEVAAGMVFYAGAVIYFLAATFKTDDEYFLVPMKASEWDDTLQLLVNCGLGSFQSMMENLN